MRHRKSLLVAAVAAICAEISGPTQAAGLDALTPEDAQHYALAFKSVDRGDYVDAALQTTEIADPSLTGYITFAQLMHPTAHKSDYEELSGWLSQYADLPVADRIFALASKRKPADTGPMATPALTGVDFSKIELVPPGTGGPFDRDNTRLARLAFYSGDTRRAFELAKAVGDRWITGMAAYRLKKYDVAEAALAALSKDPREDVWVRAGAAFWAARAAQAMVPKDPVAFERSAIYLRRAASAPQTFYGMIAERQVELADLGSPLPLLDDASVAATPILQKASFAPTVDVDLAGLVRDDPRAHRAAALAQIGRVDEAAQELRAGLALASTQEERERWSALAALINADLADEPDDESTPEPRTSNPTPSYPTPRLHPSKGFRIQKALVYAIVRQESRFNPGVVSPAGAVGLMQLMPDSAADASGNSRLRADPRSLFDPSYNLKVGQDYVTWLMGQQGAGYDILRTVAAYNGGPATLQKTADMLGDDVDSLMVIECMPAPETRDYVEKVMAAYWTYRKKFGQDAKTLDALANGEKFVDVRWDTEPPPPPQKSSRRHAHKGSGHARGKRRHT